MLECSGGEVQEVYAVVGGHPYAVRFRFESAGHCVAQLVGGCCAGGEIFSAHPVEAGEAAP